MIYLKVTPCLAETASDYGDCVTAGPSVGNWASILPEHNYRCVVKNA